MKTVNYISSYCVIENNRVLVNGTQVPLPESGSFSEFAKTVYKTLAMDYPKFFKMDSLSKLAFLASEIILKEVVKSEEEQDIALVFANRSSSLDTDVKYQESIANKEEYFPSPAVFVYTLPNICIGEVSIRHQLKSENAFFVFEDFPAEFMQKYSEGLIENNKAKKVVCGWVEYFQENYKAFVYLVEPQGALEHNEQNINTLHKN